MQPYTDEKIQHLEKLGIMTMLPRKPERVIILDQDIERGKTLKNMFGKNGLSPIVVTDLENAQRVLFETQPETLVAFTSPDTSAERIVDATDSSGVELVLVGPHDKADRNFVTKSSAYLYSNNLNDLYRNISASVGESPLSDVALFNEITGIQFYKGNMPISPEGVFNITYREFLPVVERNKTARKIINKTAGRISMEKEIQQALEKWKQQLPSDVIAIVQTSDGQFKFDVNTRTNMDELMIKLPSILYLGRNFNHLILRDAKIYPPEEAFEGTRDFGSRIDKEYYKRMYDGNLEGAQPNPLKYILVPEPFLLASLQQMYEEGGPIITPNIKAVGIDNRNVFYIRAWLPPVRDLPIDYRKMAEHLAALHGYGLFEVEERRSAHYVEEGDIIVNLDPDYILNCMKKCGRLDEDMHEFYAKISGDHPLFRPLTKLTMKAEFKRPYRDARRQYEKERYQERFLAAIPTKLEDSILKDLMI